MWVIDRTFFSQTDGIERNNENIKLILSTTQQFETLITKLDKELQSIGSVNNVWFQWNNKQAGQLVNVIDGSNTKPIKANNELYNFISDRMDVVITEELPYQLETADGAEADRIKKSIKQLKDNHVGLVLPIGKRRELIGAFFFGKRPDKSAFTAEIVRRIQQLQKPVTSAVANALFYKQAVERIAKVSG